MTSGPRHDPIALFAFALRERDWVPAELIARSLSGEPAMTQRLETVTAEASADGPAPVTLRQLRGWAQIARILGIGD